MKKHILPIVLGAVLVALSPASAADPYPLKTCVVSGDVYGGDLGPPVKITYQGREIILCCQSCVKKFYRDPAKYLAVLDQAAQGKK